MDGTGPNSLFTQDPRPQLAATALGRNDYRGMHILEIGPVEAAHTYMLEQMGAERITCVEASAEAWLKCLVVKELLALNRSRFLLGNIVAFLHENRRRFDLVYCSGVLYHMADPVELIEAIAKTADACFVWTHVYNSERHPVTFAAERVTRLGIEVNYWSHRYGSKAEKHWCGIDATAAWLTSEDMLRAFVAAGLSNINLIENQPGHPNGPAVLFTARRP